MSDLLNTTEVEVTDVKHLRSIFETLALLVAAEMLEKLSEKHGLAGTGLAHATIEAHAQRQRANMIAQNMRLCAKAGVDFNAKTMNIDTREGGRVYIVCKDDPDTE